MRIDDNALDVLFSKIIRLRAKGYCEIGGEWIGFERLMACHNWGRRKKSVRWDFDNACSGCLCHHQLIDKDKKAKTELFIKYLGEDKFIRLNQRANWPSQYNPNKKLIKQVLEKEFQKYVTLSDLD